MKCDSESLTKSVIVANWVVPFMGYTHLCCLLLYVLRKPQSTMAMYGAYTKVVFAWAYAALYIGSIVYCIFDKRRYMLIEGATDIEEEVDK